VEPVGGKIGVSTGVIEGYIGFDGLEVWHRLCDRRVYIYIQGIGIMGRVAMFLVALVAMCVAHAREFQTIDPSRDQEFINKLGMYQIGDVVPARFNLMIIGQDDRSGSSKMKKNSSLASRADILMVLSIDTQTGAMDILSMYRDNPVTQGCIDKLGRVPSYIEKINGVYSVGGRRQFIPCFEGMLEERLRSKADLSNLLDKNGHFEIHAFFEGTRTYTVRPVAKESLKVVLGNKFAFATTYGVSALGAALDVLWQGNDLQKVLNAEEDVVVNDKNVNSDYLITELKERKIYRAGGYQRAFNFATVVASTLGWAAYGIQQYESYDYEFLGYYFGDVINNNFSRSHDIKELERAVFKKENDHLLKYACFVSDQSPIRIIQWSENSRIYAIYENGKLSVSRKGSLLDFLKIVPILPNPPSCG
jgi:hypothetical protein